MSCQSAFSNENLYWEFPIADTFAEAKRLEVRETSCSSLLHLMNFGSNSEYTINQYRGCSHGCVYCYAPSLIHDERNWGSFVDVKINADRVLERELAQAEKRVVFVSSASDPYQPVEARYKITRKVLQVLTKHRFPVLLLTRSPLVLRDLDLLQKLEWVRVGLSISSVSTKFYEPGVPSVEKRLDALCKLHDKGIQTWVSMAPVVPTLILTDLDRLFQSFHDAGISALTVGLLRFNGYQKSQEMFEKRSGRSAGEVMEGGREIRQNILAKAQSYGLDTSGSSLSWDPPESPQTPSLDSFDK